MSNEVKISAAQKRRINKFPCDGVPRYKVSGQTGCTYSQAYELIFTETGGTKDSTGRRVYTRKGIRRIAALNDLYLVTAGVFVTKHLAAIGKAVDAIRDVVADEEKAASGAATAEQAAPAPAT